MSERRGPSVGRWLLLGLLAALFPYVGAYLIQSRIWQSELEAELSRVPIVGATSYVPIRYLATDEGYVVHRFFMAFYEPLWRLDQKLGGPYPINIPNGGEWKPSPR